MEQSERDQLVKREKIKYNQLYSEDNNYGWKTGRPKTFLRGNDETHKSIKTAIMESVTMLDVGCGRGYFTDFFKREYPHLQITCIDIAAKQIRKYRPDMNIIEASADNLSMFPDRRFDLVMHLDGMEHIPQEIEEKAFSEEVRVSNKYLYHQIAVHPVKRDQYWIDKGLGAIHINLRTADDWKIIMQVWANKYEMEIKYFMDYRQWVHILLERRK